MPTAKPRQVNKNTIAMTVSSAVTPFRMVFFIRDPVLFIGHP